MDDELCPGCAGERDDRVRRFGIDDASEEGSETDAELEAWLAARVADWEAQRWALAEQEVEGW